MMEKQEIVNEYTRKLTEAKHAMDTFTEEYDRESNELKKLKLQVSDAQENIAKESDEKENLDREIPDMETQIKNSETEVSRLKESRVIIQEKIAEVQVKLNEAKSSGGEQRQRNQVFDYIMNHLKRKKIVQGNPRVY